MLLHCLHLSDRGCHGWGCDIPQPWLHTCRTSYHPLFCLIATERHHKTKKMHHTLHISKISFTRSTFLQHLFDVCSCVLMFNFILFYIFCKHSMCLCAVKGCVFSHQTCGTQTKETNQHRPSISSLITTYEISCFSVGGRFTCSLTGWLGSLALSSVCAISPKVTLPDHSPALRQTT